MSYYPREERETLMLYDAQQKQWKVSSTVPRDIRRIDKIGDVFYREYDDEGRLICVEAILSPSQVRLYGK